MVKLFVREKDVCFFILILFLIDSTFHISNNILAGSNIGRLLMLMVMLAFSAFPVIQGRKIAMRGMYIPIVLLILLIFLGLIRTILVDGDVEFAIGYIKYGFVYLSYIPILTHVLKDEKDIKKLSVAVSLIGSTLSVLSILLLCLWFVSTSLFWRIAETLYNYGIANIIIPFGVTVRIMMSGIVFQIIAVFASLHILLTTKNKINYVIILLNGLGILISYSRTIIAGMFIGFILWIYWAKSVDKFYKKEYRRILLYVVIVLAVVLFYTMIGTHGDVFQYLLDRFNGNSSDTVASDSFRRTMVDMVNSNIWRHPLFGGGLGEHVNLRDGAIEMSYHDLIIRLGFVGLICLLLPYIMMFVKVNHKSTLYIPNFCYFSALTSVMVATYTNPYLITSVGLFIYCLSIRLYTMRCEQVRW